MGIRAAQPEFLVDTNYSKRGSTWVFQAAQHCGRDETANENGTSEKENHSLWEFCFFFKSMSAVSPLTEACEWRLLPPH